MNEAKQLQNHLQRLGRHLRWRDGLRLAGRSLWPVLLAAVFIQIAARFWPIPNSQLGLAVLLGLWLSGLILYTFLRPLSLFYIARRLDTELHLKDRLATALELQAQQSGASDTLHPPSFPSLPSSILPPFPSSILPSLQLTDALTIAQSLTPSQLAWNFPRRSLSVAGGFILILLTLNFLPNPMDAILAQRVALQEAAQKQAEAIHEERRQFEKATEPTSEERAKALQALAELMQQLAANPGDLEQALADLAKAEAKLNELQDAQAIARQDMSEQIADQLAALAQKSNQNSTNADAATALTELAATLGGLDSAAQQELAQLLEQLAAQAAPTDAELAQALADLAQAARAGDTAAALKAADSASAVMARSNQAADLQQALAQAQAQLERSRQSLAEQGALAQAQAQGQGQGQNPGQGQGQGQNPGQGQGQGQQVGGGGGSNANQLPGANRTGVGGDPTQPNKPATLTEAEKIYAPIDPQSAGKPEFVPGQETGQGQVINRQEQTLQGGVNNPSLVPYQQVYQNYAAAAAEAIDREQIPADMQDLVRDYFSQLAPE